MVAIIFSPTVDRYLVNKTHKIGIRPSRFVQVIGLLQHLRKLLGSNISKIKEVISFFSTKRIKSFRYFLEGRSREQFSKKYKAHFYGEGGLMLLGVYFHGILPLSITSIIFFSIYLSFYRSNSYRSFMLLQAL